MSNESVPLAHPPGHPSARLVLHAAPLILALLMAPAAHAALVIDGIADEPEWQQAQVFDRFQVIQPYTLAAPRHASVARLIGTPEGIAVAFDLQQPAGTARQKVRTARDADIPGDRVNVYVDFDANGVVAYDFTVGLNGSQQDATVTNETAFSNDWDGDWQSAVSERDAGWSVEILIPWSVASMGGSDGDRRTIGILFDRVLGETSERSATAPISHERTPYVSNFPRVEIAQYRDASLHVFPYVSARQDFVGNSLEWKTGADLQWKPSGSFQLVAALNPDFGQVESDQLVVNFDAIETYFSDRRPFFTENQGMFALTTPNEGRLIYTRRIGGPRDDGRGVADIDAALKVTGSARGLSYGALGAVESDHADDLGRAYYAQRLSYPVGPWTLGYVATWADRPLLDRNALVQAADLEYRPSEVVHLDAQVIFSDVSDSGADTRGTGAWLRLDLAPPGPMRHQLELAHFDRTLDFNDLGFLPRANYNELEWTTEYTQSDYAPDSRLASTLWHVEPQARYNDDGDRLGFVMELYRRDTFRSGMVLFSEWNQRTAGYDDLISRGNGRVQRPPRGSGYVSLETPRLGDWRYNVAGWLFQEGLTRWAFETQASVTYYAGDSLSLNGYLNARRSNDWLIWHHDTQLASYRRDLVQTGLNIDWLPADRHELRAKLQWLALDAQDAESYRIGAGGALAHTPESIPDFAIKNFGLQLRYRWTFAPQSDLYVVYSRGGFERRDEDDDGIADLLTDATSLRDSDQFLVKVRYRF